MNDIPKSSFADRIGLYWLRFKQAYPKLFRSRRNQIPAPIDFDFSGDFTASVEKLKKALEENHADIMRILRSTTRLLYSEFALMSFLCVSLTWESIIIFSDGGTLLRWLCIGINSGSAALTLYNFRRSLALLQEVTTTHILFHIQEDGLESVLNELKNG